MSAISYYVGESWGDHPACVAPEIRTLAILVNDGLGAGDREEVIGPHLFAPIGTATGDVEVLCRRALAIADWAVRWCTPVALEAAGLGSEAERLRRLGEVDTAAAAAKGAKAAAWAAAGAAAWAAAERAAAWAAAGSAARAAWVAAKGAGAFWTAEAAKWAAETAVKTAVGAAGAAAEAAEAAAQQEREVWVSLRDLILRLCAMGERREVVPARSVEEVCALGAGGER